MSKRRWADWVEPAHTKAELTLMPIFGVRAWSPQSTCADVHPHGKMPSGTRCCCMACHQTGQEKHPDLRTTATDQLALARWEPPDGVDEWSYPDAAEPTRYVPPAPEVKLDRRAWRDIYYGRVPAPEGYELDPMNRGYLKPIDPARILRVLGE